MNWTSPSLLIAFALVWIATFVIAWKTLARLVAVSMAQKYTWKNPRFWALFIFYRLIIIAPYGVYLLFGRNVPTSLRSIIIGFLVFGVVLSLIRFFGPRYLIRLLWGFYGLFYDGVLGLYPYRHLIGQIVTALDLKPGQRLLDLGCGTGNLIVAVQNDGLNVVGVDSSKTMLWSARRKLRSSLKSGRVEVIESDVLAYLRNAPANSFDRIALVNVVYAVADRSHLWTDLLRVLKPDGVIAVTNSDRDGSKAIIKEHLENDSRWKLLRLRLLIVGAIDYFISELSRAGMFHFVQRDALFTEITAQGGQPTFMTRTYGGSENGVNILFTITK